MNSYRRCFYRLNQRVYRHFITDFQHANTRREKRFCVASSAGSDFAYKKASGSTVPNLEMKLRAMSLIAEAHMWHTC